MERAQSSPTIGEIVNDERYRSIFYQILVFGVVAWVVYTLVGNTQDNLARRGMTAGFDFLGATAGFAIAWTPLDYKPNDSYLYVYWVGIVNTLLLSSVAIVLSTILGFFVGILRLSKNWLVSQLASWYVEFLRNTPLLLQIIFISSVRVRVRVLLHNYQYLFLLKLNSYTTWSSRSRSR